MDRIVIEKSNEDSFNFTVSMMGPDKALQPLAGFEDEKSAMAHARECALDIKSFIEYRS